MKLLSRCGVILLLLVAGCGGASTSGVVKVAEAERTRGTLAGKDVQALAPQAFAEAEQALRAAKDAERAGDMLAAELHAERAVAAYQHAIALARLTHATDDEAQAKELVRRLHELLIPPSPEGSEVFGPSWEELTAAAAAR